MSHKNKYYDVIIVGSGMSGLYSAYKIKKQSPNTRFLVLEKYKKHWVGGRTNNFDFYGTSVVTGAGIGRNDTNPLLIKLMKELHVPFKKTTSIMKYSKLLQHHSEFDVVKIIDFLKKEYNKNPSKYRNLTFKEFAIKILGDTNYKLFTIYAGYTDYENADVYETLYNYGMDDNKGGWSKLYIPWKELVHHLCDYIEHKNIKYSNNVVEITKVSGHGNYLYKREQEPCLFETRTDDGIIYYSNKVIIATTISGIMKLVPNASKPNSLYHQIHGQPFLRLYAKFDRKSSELLKKCISEYTIVPGALQKIIPINSDNGVYMIAYSDNENALLLKDRLKNTLTNRNLYEKLIEESLGIPKGSLKIIAIKDFYWPIGTHYYEPLQGLKTREDFVFKVQHPMDGMLVVGEAVSTYQGWVEGALESVEAVVDKNWINTICYG
uniref:Amine oxidase domain-containing protein n=1 Tax=viral metagenome TaxID=1070528 RepID=A0A6C0JET0_9ZZZZ